MIVLLSPPDRQAKGLGSCPFGTFENSQPHARVIYGWVHYPKPTLSPAGTKETPRRPILRNSRCLGDSVAGIRVRYPKTIKLLQGCARPLGGGRGWGYSTRNNPLKLFKRF